MTYRYKKCSQEYKPHHLLNSFPQPQFQIRRCSLSSARSFLFLCFCFPPASHTLLGFPSRQLPLLLLYKPMPSSDHCKLSQWVRQESHCQALLDVFSAKNCTLRQGKRAFLKLTLNSWKALHNRYVS